MELKRDYWADDFRPSQNRVELPRMLAMVGEPKVILEIGVYRCGLLRVFKEEFDPDVLVGVDNTEQPLSPKWRVGVEGAVLIAPADSHDPETVRKVKRALRRREVDLLFIDADHAYDAVKKDFELYGPLVRDGGWIGFHDIAFGPDLGKGLCPEFWRGEVRDRYETYEFISDTGIGLVRWTS